MRVKTEEYLKRLTENTESALLQAAREAKDDSGQPLPVGEASFVAENGVYEITLRVTDPSKSQAVIDAVKKKVDLVNWTQSTSGNAITWSLPKQMQAHLKDQATDQAFKIIDSRINAFGVKEPTLQRQGASDSGLILLQMRVSRIRNV
jgi:preprotein translocase subunit SecD